MGFAKDSSSKIQGIRITTVNIALIAMSSVCYVVIFYMMYISICQFSAMKEATDDYIFCEQSIVQLRAGSDTLTEDVRNFAITGEKKYADAYFHEATVARRRDRAVNNICSLLDHSEACSHLKLSLQQSNELMKLEYRAMRLVAESSGQELALFPEAVREYPLTEEERNLSNEEKLRRARVLVLGDVYRQYKEKIYADCAASLDTISRLLKEPHDVDMQKRGSTLYVTAIVVVFVFLLSVAVFILISNLVIRPLKLYIQLAHDNRQFDIIGAYEFKQLALTYNNVYELNMENEARLRQEAEKDPLTQLYNRRQFDSMLNNMAGFPGVILAIIDVDNFKQVNDEYGHSTGDAVLKKVASGLKSVFRPGDFIARIGGDEFTVLFRCSPDKWAHIRERFMELERQLAGSGSDGLPSVTLSVGVAFSSHSGDGGDELFKKADAALYHVKEHGRNGVCSYDEIASS